MRKKVNFMYVIPITILVAIVSIYILISIIVPSFSMVYVEPAQYETVYHTLKSDGYILRNESYVINDNGGVLYYNIEDAGKVAKGGAIASVYETENDAINASKMNKLKEKIENLQKLNSLSQVTGASLEAVNKSISQYLTEFISNVENNNFTSANKIMDSLSYSLNEKQVIVNNTNNFNDYIEELMQEKEVLEKSTNSAVGKIQSSMAGTFTSQTDGYENSFDFAKASKMNYQQLTALEEGEAQKVPENVIGKIISDVNWLICCPMTAEDAKVFEDIQELVEVEIPYASSDKLSAKVVSVNEDDNGNAVVILECKEMNNTLAQIRKEEVKIAVKSYSGIKIDKNAVHRDIVTKTTENGDGTTNTEEKEVDGVYILYGNELRFREIIKLYETDEFVICDTDEENEKLFNGTTIKLYDEIVTEGTDLYAGKIVKQSAEIS